METAGPSHRRPRTFPLTDSSGTDTSAPPHAKRMFGAPSRRGAATSSAGFDCQLNALDCDPEKQAMRAALAEKDAMIAALQESVNRMQRTLEAMLTAMTTQGTIPPAAAAAALAEAQAPQQAMVMHQLQQSPQELQPHQQGTEHRTDEATMWARADAPSREDDMSDPAGW